MSFTFYLEPNEHITLVDATMIAQMKTPYQLIQLVRIPELGDAIFIDGYPQISTADAAIFNEVLAHAALCAVSNPKQVFVAGIGSGGAIFEITKHPSLRRIIATDIDFEAVSFYREHLPQWHSQNLTDKRVEYVLKDGRAVLENIAPNSLDVIILDLPDPLPELPSRTLFTSEFYSLCYDRLSHNGVFLTQAGRFRVGAMDYHRRVRATVLAVFKRIKTYYLYYPCYYEPWSFILGSKKDLVTFPSAARIDRRLDQRSITDLIYYSGEIDRSLSTIPKLYQQALSNLPPHLSDGRPMEQLF